MVRLKGYALEYDHVFLLFVPPTLKVDIVFLFFARACGYVTHCQCLRSPT